MDGSWLGTAEAAEIARVSPRELRRLASGGRVQAERRGGRLFFQRDDMLALAEARRPRGQPLSPEVAWLALLELAGDAGEGGTAMQRYRARLKLGKEPSPAAFVRRADAPAWFAAHPSRLAALLDDERVLESGGRQARRAGADLAGPDADGAPHLLYVGAVDLDGVVADHRLAKASARLANVALRVMPGRRAPEVAAALRPLVAIDLVESRESRARRAGRDLWDSLLEDYLAAD